MSSEFDKLVRDLIDIIKSSDKGKTSPYDTQAEVIRVEDNIAWVHIPGGVDETPVKLTMNAQAGDIVQLRISGGRAWIAGNATAPPTDDRVAIIARSIATAAAQAAEAAQETADGATRQARENAAEMAQIVLDFDADIADLQSQIDGNITSWFYNYVPTTSNQPAATWISEGSEAVHLGDLFYDTSTGYAYRWMSNGATPPVYSWQRITDSDVTKALADAAKAQDTADQKRRVFYAQPVPPYDVGDLWVQGSNGDILRCSQAKSSSGSYSASDWVLASKYTDDSALTTWIAGDFAQAVADLEAGIVDAKVETYYQTTDPSTNWTAQQKSDHAGDLWYNSTSTVQKYYRWNGTAWQELTATPPTAVFDRIDGKATIFVGSTTPVNPSSGDLWFKGEDEPILTYVNGNWIEYNVYVNPEEMYAQITTAVDAMTTYTFYKYASTAAGTGFSDDDSLQYRGVYVSTENEASSNPSDYLWEINPSWAVKYADNYIEDEVSTSGFRIVSPDPTTYARFTALFMAFFMNDVLQMRMGYDATNEVYGVLAKNIFALGSGAGVKFDGSTEATTRGRFVWEIRDNGHLSLKRF